MSTIVNLESKEPNKEEIQKILKQNLLKLFSQVKKGCKRKICYNTLCANNAICKNSKNILTNFNFSLSTSQRSANIQKFNTSKRRNE